MGVGHVAAADLDEFVAEYDERGGIADPVAQVWVSDFSLGFVTPVDVEADGFSERYSKMQLDLYRELSGREVDQTTNEMHVDLDLDRLVAAANPYGSVDVDHIAKHARTILTALVVSDLAPEARVLDMGCGWGISTEMLAFSGCAVTAVDINPEFVQLVERRAKARGYAVQVEVGSFDEYEPAGQYDLVFFYECLHHAIAPWRVIDRLGRHLAPGGKFTIAGEPIQDTWWPSWGLRLDPQSVYCIRKYGWFESGWSRPFITECFTRAGFELTVLERIGIGHSDIGVAVRPGEHAEPPTAHWVVPVPRGDDAPEPTRAQRALARARCLPRLRPR